MQPIDVIEGVTDEQGAPPNGWEAIVIAKNQPEYLPLPSLVSADGRVVSRWKLTEEERVAVANGADLFLTVTTHQARLQPVMLQIAEDPASIVEPLF